MNIQHNKTLVNNLSIILKTNIINISPWKNFNQVCSAFRKMNRWKPSQICLFYTNLRSVLFHQLKKHHHIFRRNFSSTIFVSKCVLPSMLSSLLVLKVLTKDNKSAVNHKIIQEADILYNDAEYDKLHSLLNFHKETNDPEILWRLARANFEIARPKGEKEKLGHYEEALALVDKALAINEECWAAHKWRGILLDYVWRYKSTKERISHSFEVKKHLQRAIELNPKDGTNYYILGEWCYTFADMPWYQRKVAAAIFASPPTSTYQEALNYFETAEKVDPLFYSLNILMIAKCYLKLNDKDKARAFLSMTVKYPIKTEDDKKAHEEAEKLLKDL